MDPNEAGLGSRRRSEKEIEMKKGRISKTVSLESFIKLYVGINEIK